MDTHGSACIHNHKVISFDLCVLYIDDVSVYDFIIGYLHENGQTFASNRIDGTNAFDEHISDFRHFLIKADYKKKTRQKKRKKIRNNHIDLHTGSKFIDENIVYVPCTTYMCIVNGNILVDHFSCRL